MKTYKSVMLLLVSLLFLGACSNNDNNKKMTSIPDIPAVIEPTKDTSVSIPDLNTNEGIKEYLIGEWVFDNEFVSRKLVKMNIDESLNVDLTFIDDKNEEKYKGKIYLDRIYTEEGQAPDIISVKLDDPEEPGGDYFFQHKTVYNQKRLMSWFFAGNGSCVFDKLNTEVVEKVPSEIMFEKITGEVSELKVLKDKEFYAAFYNNDTDEKSIWLDEVICIQENSDEYTTMYPREVTNYDNDIKESVLYQVEIDENTVETSWGDDLYPGNVYFVKTDAQGRVTQFIDADRKLFLDNSLKIKDTKELVLDIIKNDCRETQYYLDLGMSIEYNEDTVILDDNEFYLVYLGTQHDDYFVRELTYAVNLDLNEVYYYEVVSDEWFEVAR